MIVPIQTGTDNEILRKKSTKVEKITKDIKKLVKDLQETLEASGNGIGLAAPQIGVHKRVILISLFDKKERVEKVLVMINPEITKYSFETVVMEEGCLSIPDKYEKVERPESIEVKYMDIKGKEHTLHMDGIHAREVMHETDHLDGILFTDLIKNKKGSSIISRVPGAI